MPRTKKSTPKTAQWNRESATIMSAMQSLLPIGEEVYNAVIDDSAVEPLEYIMSRLSMTREQARLIVACCYCAALHHRNPCDIDDLCRILNLHPLEAMTLETELNALEDMGYLYYRSDLNEGWLLEPKALAALRHNKAFDIAELSYESNMDFLSEAYRIVKDGMRHDSQNTIVPPIQRMMRRNPQLPVVQSLEKFNAMQVEQWGMLLFLAVLGAGEEDFVDSRDLEQILSRTAARKLLRAFSAGTHAFVTNGWIEPYGGEGIAQAERWIMTEKGWNEMLKNDEEVKILIALDDVDKSLTAFSSLTKRELFFSEKTQSQVDRLFNLLEDEQFMRIHQALKDKGMPTGFCCLFYGTPGTGKTECVQQLAIATGRDIMQVNIGTLRDKYVGESEKRLQGIFDSYRVLVSKQKKAPILFFNEADAIFGNRMENTQRAVDKMENAMQNIILQEMEKLDGILICTTNLTSNLDKAFDRRFLYKVEFERPTNEARQRIWKSMLTDLTDEQASNLATQFDFSGGQIQNISRKQIINSIFSGTNKLDFDQIQEDCRAEKLSRTNGQRIGF